MDSMEKGSIGPTIKVVRFSDESVSERINTNSAPWYMYRPAYIEKLKYNI